ncbi:MULTISPECIES: 7-cyano-7-deazaguanine synthase QueC [Oceanobacillus]|uniref:7-cyano-7-deazaguanine synthase n=1 Tax=Oceanobacillus kimchii TaxID=746691 RepID=A0ABQ5TD46_9BACI|nr:MULTISPECIES: 7-cyano-7-deazaguanine synthase QueC [Oceanobacillus]MBT2653106.1 7-cyano-7-deazaguanine synthase QueC [Oceanobacillus sp. ISL-73]MCT1577712.1 7-cyano-7-deazaguanine synthase QueC [Oceanobacillus kimchii]MCT2136700.1 7-cyano-7-deazaguanine synthase QueC [Oceanobacillus kimchii]OEH53836.1 7-cyano-7-deazaguanine synthase [Oceanobacillus sp. E9]GLO64568.1 7-cyano-7-deazaguanine synthase [Oceanobacillus kimchii]
MNSKKAIVILSGGLDSTTCMGVAKEAGYDIYPITFHYGQRHDREIENAKKVASYFDAAEHKVFSLEFLKEIGGSSLTDQLMEVNQEGVGEDVPNTYVPGRNTIFLSIAASYAEAIGAEKIYVGVSAVDFSGYPDCRPEFIEAMQQTIFQGTNAEPTITIEAPLIDLSKGDTVKLGMELNVPYHLTTSCYLGGEEACGECDSCRLRLQGFEEAGATDPIKYM